MRKKKKNFSLEKNIHETLTEIKYLLRKIHEDLPKKYSGKLGPM